MDNASAAAATMTRPEAAAYLGRKPSTLERWWALDIGPRGFKLGQARQSRVLYAKGELDRFIAAGMPLHSGAARPKSIPRGCFEAPARGRRRSVDRHSDSTANHK